MKVTQSCPTLCDPMDQSPPGSSVHGDAPGKNTGEAFPFSKESSQPRNQTQVFPAEPQGKPKESWSGQPFSSLAYLPDPGIELGPPALQAGSIPTESSGKPCFFNTDSPGGGMCGDNRKVRMHGNTVVSTYSWGFLFSLMTLVCKIPVGYDSLTTTAQS